jgi:hypothetical protein
MSSDFDDLFSAHERRHMSRRATAFSVLAQAAAGAVKFPSDARNRHLACAIRIARRWGLKDDEIKTTINQTREEAARG